MDASKYSEVMKAVRSNVKLKGKIMLELKRDKTRKGAAYRCLTEMLLSKSVEIRTLTAEATSRLKNLDDITDAEKLVTVLRQQCEV